MQSDNVQFSTESLLQLLDTIKNDINNKQLTVDDQEKLWDSLTWNKNDPDNKELIKYLFTGWWIHQQVPTTDSN